MKSVLISIQPYWVFLIIARLMGWNIPQEKTVEVRKDFPKASDWDKRVHIYCSKNKKSFNRIPKEYQPLMEKLLGKVVGEFVCDSIDEQIVFHKGITNIMIQDYKEKLFSLSEAAALSLDELHDYINKDGKDFETVYSWHISDLKIYDKPKGLGEFFRPCDGCDKLGTSRCTEEISPCRAKTLTRPPQSWQYVDEL